MKRRELLCFAITLLVSPLAGAQKAGRTYRVGVMLSGNPESMSGFLQALRDRLATKDFVEGRNLRIEVRQTAFDSAVDKETARTLAASRPDAIFSLSSRVTKIVQEVAGDVPVVFTFVGDAVTYGIVSDFARPGGNTTGVSWRQFEMAAKRLEFLRELLPRARRVVLAGYLGDISFLATEKQLRELAARLGFELIDAEGAPGISEAVGRAMRNGADAVFVYQPISMIGATAAAKAIIRDATDRRIPVFFPEADLVELGGVLAYGPSPLEEVRRGADLLARVLRGERPADLPVDLATHFNLTVNLKAARALGIKIPQTILVRADRLIE